MNQYTTGIDGDTSAKVFEQGANSAMPTTDLADGIHENARLRQEPAGEKTTGTGTNAFHSEGSVGKQFTTEGSVGGTAQQLGGPFSRDGVIGKHFTKGGALGANVEENLGKGESHSVRSKDDNQPKQ